MDDRFRVDFRRGALAGVTAATVVAFMAGLAVRAYADERPTPAGDRPAVTARLGDRPGLSGPAEPAAGDCPPSSSPAAGR